MKVMDLPVVADTREASSFEAAIKRRRGGRPERSINLGELEKLCAIHATIMEIASWFGVGHATIERRIADKTLHDHDGEKLTFKEIMDRGYARGRISLRRKQMQLAEQGNATMLVWLGKQLLGQRDTVEQIAGADGGPSEIKIIRVSYRPPHGIDAESPPASANGSESTTGPRLLTAGNTPSPLAADAKYNRGSGGAFS